MRCKLVALVKGSDFEGAIAFLDKTPALKLALFERAYCLFRLNRFDEALKVCRFLVPNNLKEADWDSLAWGIGASFGLKTIRRFPCFRHYRLRRVWPHRC